MHRSIYRSVKHFFGKPAGPFESRGRAKGSSAFKWKFLNCSDILKTAREKCGCKIWVAKIYGAQKSALRSSKERNAFMPKRQTQLDLIPRKWFESTTFGGEKNSGKRKAVRPFSLTKNTHLILKASKSILLSKKLLIQKQIQRFSGKHQIQIKDMVIHHNHIHFHIKISNRDNYRRFVRALTSKISDLFKFKNLWLQLPFTRILNSKREYVNLIAYFHKNRVEVRWIQKIALDSDFDW